MRVRGKHTFDIAPEIQGTTDKFVAVKSTTTAPTVNDDNTQGYYVGYKWVDTTTGVTYHCENATTGAAIWKSLDTQVQTLQSQVDLLSPATVLISGNVVYSTGLTYDVSALVYKIQGVTYNTAATSITLNAADPTDPRIDVIYADSNGVVGKLTGTPAPSPSKPSIDPDTQIELTFVTIAAGATTPTINSENIYLENTEWTSSTNTTVSFVSTASPRTGTVSIETTSALNNGGYLKFNTTSYAVVGGNLTFYIKLKAIMSGNLVIRFYNATASQGVGVSFGTSNSFGINLNDTTSYQAVSIPMSSFGALSNVDELRFTKQSGAGSVVNFFMDDILIQEIATTVPASSIGDLTDVDITGITNNQILKWNSTTAKFEPANEAGGASTESINIPIVAGVVSKATSGTASNGYFPVGNETSAGTSGNGTGRFQFLFKVPANYVSGGELKLDVRRSSAVNAHTATAYINDVVDATINSTSIAATAVNTWEVKTLIFGSSIAPGNSIAIDIFSDVGNGIVAYVKAAQFNYNR